MTESSQSIADLLKQFHRETSHHCSMVGILHKPSSIALVAIGEPVVEFIFRQGVSFDYHLMTLLNKITGQNPVPKEHAGLVREMREDWQNWAIQNNYL